MPWEHNMVEFEIKIHPEQRLAYIPKELANVLGNRVKAVPNVTSVLFYPESADPNDVLRSLETIRNHIQQYLELQKKRRVKPHE